MSSQRLHEHTNLRLHIRLSRVVERLGDDGKNNYAEAVTQAVGGDSQRAVFHAELFRNDGLVIVAIGTDAEQKGA